MFFPRDGYFTKKKESCEQAPYLGILHTSRIEGQMRSFSYLPFVSFALAPYLNWAAPQWSADQKCERNWSRPLKTRWCAWYPCISSCDFASMVQYCKGCESSRNTLSLVDPYLLTCSKLWGMASALVIKSVAIEIVWAEYNVFFIASNLQSITFSVDFLNK